ncbi:MAG TPA: hypothetical protein VHV77_15420 [Pirellulales bacterium]|jgi:hypothetical protein|nr:hypothetical protein [Pirellulales bacterium]
MFVPRFWYKAETEFTPSKGEPYKLAVWRGSASTLDEARVEAEKAVERLRQRIEHGEPFPDSYGYGVHPRREVVIEAISTVDGNEAVITRNAYGALVLNSARTFFIDVDLLEAKPTSVAGKLIGRFLGRKTTETETPEAAALVLLKGWLAKHEDWGVRIYRTRSGLRYLVTHSLYDPGSAETEAAMQFLGADAQYVRLCRAQQCFRARLTPKPWRCGLLTPPMRSPWDSPDRMGEMQSWLLLYASAIEKFATCKLLGSMGSDRICPAVQAIIDVHDARCGVESSLPLA